MQYTESEVYYTAGDGSEMPAVFYLPEAAACLVIDVHGGAWSMGHRKSDRYLCRKLATAGIAVLSIDFRHGPDYQHPAACEDIVSAVRFVRTGGLNLSGMPIGLMGSSSGGHLALLSALLPASFVVGGESVEFVVALWPVSNPLARYQYIRARSEEDPESWQNFYPRRLAEGHRSYFGSEAVMEEAGIQRVLAAGKHTALPRTMIVQPELDQNVPVFMTQTLHGALLGAGADVSYYLYLGVEHGFALADGPRTEQCTLDVIDFMLQ